MSPPPASPVLARCHASVGLTPAASTPHEHLGGPRLRPGHLDHLQDLGSTE
ncbi:hypothetical protein R8Z50_01400 [Longispora sp. K20-0274]|uniref:hypothetical protein n=1 Tax=Longispora sp. K20-0274 TaxID=3088255 RepID=UPI00399A77BC